MTKKIIALLMLLAAAIACIPTALAAGAPEITSHPKPQTVMVGGNCSFSASANGETGITWRLQSPDGSEDFPFTDAPDYFHGLKVNGKNSDRLSLSRVPGEMDGWFVYCRYANKSGRVDTEMAPLYVTDRSGKRINGEETEPFATPGPVSDDKEYAFAPVEGEKVLQAIGCIIHFIDRDGNAKGNSFTELNFGGEYYNTLTRKIMTDGSIDVRISANLDKGRKAAYWVINGAKYTFNNEVKSFTLREVPYSMTIEVVPNGESAKTLSSMDEIQQQKTDETLLAEAKGARMSHVDEKGKASGGTFTEFDFTDDFVNRATGKTEQGGRVTVRVAASIPEGQVVSFWRFNGARMNFNSDVTSFVVENLAESMLYQPVFHAKTTPVPEYSINCKNCVFSGGGYTNAKSGTVPYGTQITITPQGNSSLGWWSGSYGTGEVNKKSITWTVKSNCSFEWHAIIN